jgi:hypothetical protein
MIIRSYTIVDGTAKTGVYAADGSYNVFDASLVEEPVGIFHPCGAYNVTFVEGQRPAVYAPNGSLYVTEIPE